MKRRVIALASAMVLAACGSGESNVEQSTATIPPGTEAGPDTVGASESPEELPETAAIVSSDGRATLQFQRGSDESAAAVSVSAQAIEPETDDNTVLFSYELQPSGLQFASPAHLTIELSPDEVEAVGNTPLVLGALVSDGGDAQFVESTVEESSGGLSLSVRIPHFSTIWIQVSGGRIVPERQEAVVGEPFSVILESPFDETPGRTTRQVPYLGLEGAVFATDVDQPADEDNRVELLCVASTDGAFERIEFRHTLPRVITGLDLDSLDIYEELAALLVGPDDLATPEYTHRFVTMTGYVKCVEPESGQSNADATDAEQRPEPPSDIYPPVGIEVTHEGPCGWPPPRPPDGALLMTNFQRPNDTAYQRGEGYALVLGTPHNAFVQFDEDGTLIAKVEPRGEPPWPEWAVIEVTHTDTTITIVVDETRYDENGPCTQRVTYVYRIGNVGEILDYIDGIPTDGVPEVDFDGVTANYEDGTFSMGGKLTFEEGVVVDLWLECSGLSLIEYRLIPIEVAADGTFLIEEEFSDCVVINLVVAANGNQITRSSVSN